MKIFLWVSVAAIVFFGFTYTVDEIKFNWANRIHTEVGRVYTNVKELCLVGNVLVETINMYDANEWRETAQKKGSPFVLVPIGSEVKISSIDKKDVFTINTGRYVYYKVTASLKLPKNSDQVSCELSQALIGEIGTRKVEPGSVVFLKEK
jgi:hypothetical protein